MKTRIYVIIWLFVLLVCPKLFSTRLGEFPGQGGLTYGDGYIKFNPSTISDKFKFPDAEVKNVEELRNLPYQLPESMLKDFSIEELCLFTTDHPCFSMYFLDMRSVSFIYVTKFNGYQELLSRNGYKQELIKLQKKYSEEDMALKVEKITRFLSVEPVYSSLSKMQKKQIFENLYSLMDDKNHNPYRHSVNANYPYWNAAILLTHYGFATPLPDPDDESFDAEWSNRCLLDIFNDSPRYGISLPPTSVRWVEQVKLYVKEMIDSFNEGD